MTLRRWAGGDGRQRVNMSRRRTQCAAGRLNRSSGFVLVLVLAMLVVTVLLTAGASRQSLQRAQQAAAATDQLQDRWARVSLQRATARFGRKWMLTNIVSADASQRARMSSAVQLNSRVYYWTVADENSKANLNTIFHRQGASEVETAIRQLAPRSRDLGLRLRPYLSTSSERDYPVFDSWGQVFERLNSPVGDSSNEPLVCSMTRDVTCWGGGRLRFSRATDDVIRATLREVVRASVVQNLIEARQPAPGKRLSELWPRLDLLEKERTTLESLLTDHSTCLSVWIWEARADVPHGIELHVSEWTADRSPVTSTFRW